MKRIASNDSPSWGERSSTLDEFVADPLMILLVVVVLGLAMFWIATIRFQKSD